MCMFVMVGGKSSGNMQTPDRKDRRHSENFKMRHCMVKNALICREEITSFHHILNGTY